MKLHPAIADTRFAKSLLASIDECEVDDPALPIARMIIGERFHPEGEYDLKPIRMMRTFMENNPSHRMSEVGNWQSDMVWMDDPDEPLTEDSPTPDLIQSPDLPVEVPSKPEDAQLARLAKQVEELRDAQSKPQTKRTLFKWDDDGRIVEKIEVVGEGQT